MISPYDGLPLRGLSETLADLKAWRHAPDPDAPTRGGGLARIAFAPNPGALEMALHVPAGVPDGAPLVLVLHGCTQSAEAFAADSGWLALAEREGFAVLAPQQTPANNLNGCFNWFLPEDMRRGAGEPASIAAMIATALTLHDLDPRRVYITGLSAGGAMTAVLLATYPELFAGGAIIAGAPYGSAQSMAQAFQTMQGRRAAPAAELGALLRGAGARRGGLPPLAIWHGDADYVVHVVNAGEIAGQWAAGQGLGLEPDEMSDGAGYARCVWRDRDGTVRIELNRIPGMGHGLPLETRGGDALGRVAPFMLQAGVNSTLEIARFWGLVRADATGPPAHRRARELAPADLTAPRPSGHGFGRLGERVMSAVSGVPDHVQAIIAGALAKGGLLK